MSWPWLKICSTCMHLDPTEHKLRALFDNLDRHQETFKKGSLVPRGKRTHITKRTGKLEIPTARCRNLSMGMSSPSPRPQMTPCLTSRSRSSRSCYDNPKIFSSSSTSTTGSYPVSPSLVLLSNLPVESVLATVGEDGSKETRDDADGDSPHASMCAAHSTALNPAQPHQLHAPARTHLP